MPELPDKKKERFIENYGLKNYDAEVLVSDKYTANYFEELAKSRQPKLVISWLTGELFSYLNKKNIELSESKISTEKLGALIDLIAGGVISNRQAKEIFEEFLQSDKNAKDFIKDKGIEQISDQSEIEGLVKSVLQKNPKMVDDYKSGKDKLFGFFVGQVMKESKGKANPQVVNNLLKDLLSKSN